MTKTKTKPKLTAKPAPPEPTPEAVVLSLRDAEWITGISVRVLARALRAGTLKGRNLEGRKGWVTTANAIRDWAEQGNPGSSDYAADEAAAHDGEAER